MQARVTVDLGYSLIEMALEDPTLTPELVLRQGADMLAAAWQNGIPGGASKRS